MSIGSIVYRGVGKHEVVCVMSVQTTGSQWIGGVVKAHPFTIFVMSAIWLVSVLVTICRMNSHPGKKTSFHQAIYPSSALFTPTPLGLRSLGGSAWAFYLE